MFIQLLLGIVVIEIDTTGGSGDSRDTSRKFHLQWWSPRQKTYFFGFGILVDAS